MTKATESSIHLRFIS